MIIYNTRYQARKNKRADEVVVKVCGGYAVMSYDEYYVWRNQR